MKGNTDYKLSLIPLGGYVQLAGESAEAELPEEFSEKESFILRPPWQRILVVAAGPIFNFVLAWIVFFGIFWAMGQAKLLPHIGTVVEKSPAAVAGMQVGDKITSIDGMPVAYWDDMATIIRTSKGKSLQLTVNRESQEVLLTITPERKVQKNIFGEDVQNYMIGISPAYDMEQIPLGMGQAAGAGVQKTWEITTLTIQGLKKLVAGIIPVRDNLGGPIMIAQLVSKQAEQGVVAFLSLFALISINLGLLNLLPIPVLDGGHILFYTIEIIIRRPLNQRMQQFAMRIGLTLLLMLLLFATFNDISRIDFSGMVNSTIHFFSGG